MPKLASKAAEVIDNTEATHGGNFEPLKPGKYLARLGKVEERNTRAGAPAWNAEFDAVFDLEGERQPGRQWLNLNLPQAKMPPSYTKGPEKWKQFQDISKGRLAAFFEAFGFTADSDTDEMLGEWAVITLGIGTIQSGARQGEKTNQVNDIEPVPEDVEIPDVEDGAMQQWSESADDEDAF